jgi:1,4-dihydroxy-6-naphthoate synthase
MQCPLPLAAIAIRRDLAAAVGPEIDRALRPSVEYAFDHPEESREYVASHAQEMDPAVAAQHIQLYINEYTVALDERAVHALLDWQQRQGPGPAVTSSLPVFA